VAVVTGAGSGIGAALCRKLVAQGVSVVAADIDADGLGKLEGVRTEVVDVTDDDQVRTLITGLDRIDYLFNNAGVLLGGDAELMTLDQWQCIVDINLWGVVHGTRHAYPVMRAQGFGHIVNTASTAGVVPLARSVAYAMTKHGSRGRTHSARGRKEQAAHRVPRYNHAVVTAYRLFPNLTDRLVAKQS
jgi:NADP-dependent 3-hydroxy acid dehydrogenase YdfG